MIGLTDAVAWLKPTLPAIETVSAPGDAHRESIEALRQSILHFESGQDATGAAIEFSEALASLGEELVGSRNDTFAQLSLEVSKTVLRHAYPFRGPGSQPHNVSQLIRKIKLVCVQAYQYDPQDLYELPPISGVLPDIVIVVTSASRLPAEPQADFATSAGPQTAPSTPPVVRATGRRSRIVGLADPTIDEVIVGLEAGDGSYATHHLEAINHAKQLISNEDLIEWLVRDADLVLARVGNRKLPDTNMALLLVNEQLGKAATGDEWKSQGRDEGEWNEECRQVWLLAIVAQHRLWKKPHGFRTNEPEVTSTIASYVGMLSRGNRYHPEAREVILQAVETQVRLLSSLPRLFVSGKPHVERHVSASMGTALQIVGPDPVLPDASKQDPRVMTRGTREDPRELWPARLLKAWVGDAGKRAGACVALAGLAGWEQRRVEWVLTVLLSDRFEGTEEMQKTWLAEVRALFERMNRVRVATNPWRAPTTTGKGSTISSDESVGLLVSDHLLRAVAAQGIWPWEKLTIHGELWRNRRVPTFLVTNSYGPRSVLKLDEREKVQREAENFDEYARRLHGSHRPTECRAHAMDMHVGEDGEPHRAIETAYVFDHDDDPLTLKEWLRSAQVDDAEAVLSRFLATEMRPWIAYSKRDSIDLRFEYPLFRPHPTSGKQAPHRSAIDEIARLEAEEVAKAVGEPLKRDQRATPWLMGLPGGGEIVEAYGSRLLTNPLWLAAELGEVGKGTLASVLNSRKVGLRDFDSLLCISHGDLHPENILCAAKVRERPQTVLIDFESTHIGHLCKDLARLEASVLCELFEWSEADSRELAKWLVAGYSRGRTSPTSEGIFETPVFNSANPHLLTASRLVKLVRAFTQSCGQERWAVRDQEYLVALVASLCPMVRWTTLSNAQRQFALTLSTAVATELMARWETDLGKALGD